MVLFKFRRQLLGYRIWASRSLFSEIVYPISAVAEMIVIGCIPVLGPSEHSNLNPAMAIHTSTKVAITIRNKTNS